MAWDANTDAAVAALLVAFVALIVTSAQAIQQYLVSAQLIRICDSVVYGNMPGQGRRIWEFSQFRFRIVYSIPQIKLPPSLWSDNTSQTLSDKKGDLTLPDLQISSVQGKSGLKEVIKKQFDQQMGRNRPLICGEASWVSFCRAIQHSSGNSLWYKMIEGDADRCPTDLPVAPMQLCMRDVVTVAIMAGMECTHFSYQQQSLSMQGSAGAITSSRHPILGALIHFAPNLPLEKHGFRTKDGTVNFQWVARIRGVITVAGQQYNMRDRKHFEEDDGRWTLLSDDRSIVKYQAKNIQEPALVNSELRRRRDIHGSQAPQSQEIFTTDQSKQSTMAVAGHRSNSIMQYSMHRPQDGEWSWSLSSEGSEAEKAFISNENGCLPLTESTQPQALSSRSWYTRIIISLRRRLSSAIDPLHYTRKRSILPVSEPIGASRHKIQLAANPGIKHLDIEVHDSTLPTNPPIVMRSNQPKTAEDGVNQENFKHSIESRPSLVDNERLKNSRSNPRRLLLTSKEDQNSSIQVQNDWYTKKEQNLAAARAEQIGRKWQNIVRRRQETRARKLNKEKNQLRRRSNLLPNDENLKKKIASDAESQLKVASSNSARVRFNSHQAKSKNSSHNSTRSREEPHRGNSTTSPPNIDASGKIPHGAKWTRIDRMVVNPQALQEGDELFEERSDCVIVHRVLTKEEIEIYAWRTQKIRGMLNFVVLILPLGVFATDNQSHDCDLYFYKSDVMNANRQFRQFEANIVTNRPKERTRKSCSFIRVTRFV